MINIYDKYLSCAFGDSRLPDGTSNRWYPGQEIMFIFREWSLHHTEDRRNLEHQHSYLRSVYRKIYGKPCVCVLLFSYLFVCVCYCIFIHLCVRACVHACRVVWFKSGVLNHWLNRYLNHPKEYKNHWI